MPPALVLELTENILIEDSDRSMRVLTGLKALGVRLALDDFGTGYFYAGPMSASALSDHLAASTSRPMRLPAQRTALHRTHAS